MSEQSTHASTTPSEIGIPADQGLSALGLLMQLAGSVFAAYASLIMVVVMLAGGRMFAGQTGMMFVILIASIARSAFHRAAGTELLYGKRTLEGAGSPLAGINRYILIGLGHTALVAVLMLAKFHVPMKFVLPVVAGLAVWPAALAILLQLPRFKRFTTELPLGDDKGFEGAAILMVVLGTCGVLGTGAILFIMLDKMDALLSQGPGILLLLAMVMLFIRSVFHVQAGLAGLRETSVDRSVELSNKYANFGVISSFCASGALLMVSMMGRPNIAVVAMVAGLCWILMAWPMIIRRFFSERQFADLLAGDDAPGHRRAPDAGLTGLGWLLFAHALFGATFLIPQLLLGPEIMSGRYTEMLSMMGPIATRSLWWNAGMLTLQVWAGYELIRMGAHRRIIGTVYAVVCSVLTVYMMWPLLSNLKHMGRLGPESVVMFVPLAIQLVIPVATLLLVNRAIAPTATARFRPRPVPTPAAPTGTPDEPA